MANHDHVHADFRHVIDLSDKERIEFLHQLRWIGYSAARNVMETLTNLLAAPKRPRMPNLLIVGDPNNGKTTIIQRFRATHGEPYINENTEAVKPIIVVQAPPTADEKALLIAILEEFSIPYRVSDPLVKLRYQAIHTLRLCHVRMLIIDEIHSLLIGAAVSQRQIMNSIKYLCNELMMPIVCVGTRKAMSILSQDPQHASRFEAISLEPWKLNAEFQKLIASFESVLPLRQRSELSLPETAAILYDLSDGKIGDLHQLLIRCAEHAIKSGAEKIDRRTIEAYSWTKPTAGVRVRSA